MYTHCPHCDTNFRVTSEQLKSAGGNVRCGRCFGTFNALQNLVDNAPDASGKPQTRTNSQNRQPQAVKGKDIAKEIPAPATTSASAQSSARNRAEQELKRERSQQVLEELQNRPGARTGHNLLWTFLSLPLAVALAFQFTLLNLDQFAQRPAYRPALETLCAYVGCEVPLFKAPQQIRMVERDIRSHPDVKDILLVQARIVNDAAFTQDFPLIELSLTDITGHTLAGRRFRPSEYLVDPTIDVAKGISSKRVVTVLLELVDPGAEAVGFEFNFL